MSFIDVQKLIEVKAKHSGSDVVDPSTGKALIKEYKQEKETIRVDKIKSARAWTKNYNQERFISGELTVVYMIGDDSKDTTAQILIVEDHEEFSKRLNSIPVGDEGTK